MKLYNAERSLLRAFEGKEEIGRSPTLAIFISGVKVWALIKFHTLSEIFFVGVFAKEFLIVGN